jgi:predicted transcriptional regulator
MSKEYYLNLQTGEAVVARMAATIFAAYVQSGQVNAGNEQALIKKAVETAAQLAAHTDRIVKSDEEFMPAEAGKTVPL